MIQYIAKGIRGARKNKKGFTIIELMAVFAILAIVAAIAVPRFTGSTDKAKVKADVASAKIIAKAAEQKWIDDGSSTATDGYTATALHSAGYLKEVPTVQKSGAATGYYAALDDNGKCTAVYYGADGTGTEVAEN